MKIGITGHSRGIGAGLYERFYLDNEVLGFSRSNGFDISDKQIQNNIVEQCKDCDVFINNAYYEYAQCELVIKFIEAWRLTNNKKIICISSLSAEHLVSNNPLYSTHKAALDDLVAKMQVASSSPYICNIKPGYTDTDMNKWYTGPKMTVNDVVDIIEWIIKAPAQYHIKNISFRLNTINTPTKNLQLG